MKRNRTTAKKKKMPNTTNSEPSVIVKLELDESLLASYMIKTKVVKLEMDAKIAPSDTVKVDMKKVFADGIIHSVSSLDVIKVKKAESVEHVQDQLPCEPWDNSDEAFELAVSGASDEEIHQLSKYKFTRIEDIEKQTNEI